MASDSIPEGVAPSGKGAVTVDAEKDQYAQDNITRLKATDRVIQGAKAATEKEQQMTLMQGIKLYPKAVAWSMLISTCIVMEGYDICLINNFCRYPPFLDPWTLLIGSVVVVKGHGSVGWY
jgi:SP family general alpha glucoside:H+ symporter-like MFS transporter